MNKTIAILTLLPMLCFGQWIQIGNNINGEAAGDNFGGSISLSADGSKVAIGANMNDGNGSAAGHVRVFENLNGTWIQMGSDIDGDYGDQTGQFVSISPDGSTVAVGEPISAINGSLSGQVRVFRFTNNEWTQVGSSINGDSFNWQVGSVSLSNDGSILAVGMQAADVAGLGPFSGKARIYALQSGMWIQIGSDINAIGAEDFFGRSISLSSDGNTVAVGAIGNPFDGDIGYVSVFENISGAWTQIGATINGSTPGGEFGYTVRLSADGSTVASGEYKHMLDRGAAQVFRNVNGVWTQIGSTIVGQPGDFLGLSVALSANGNMLAVGAYGADGIEMDAGSASVFENQSGNWVLVGNTIFGEAGDYIGAAVSLSANGSIVAVSATGNDNNGNGAGQVKVFENTTVSGVDQRLLKKHITVYPNPSQDVITLSSDTEITSYELFSLHGQYIASEKVNNRTEIKLNILGLAKGAYVLKVQSNIGVFHTMVVKE